MSTLENLFKLSSKVAIYVPSTKNIDEATDNAGQVARVLRSFSEWFGGATASDALGAWVCQSNGQTVTEKIKYCFAYCTTEQLNERIEDVLILCDDLKKEMAQEAISLEINNALYFV